ncbi:MAG: mechanosensitive ion channel family protein [Deltaproteobacteria bacterium]
MKEMDLRASVIETLQGLSVLIPNKDVFQNPIVNYTNTPYRRLDLSLGTAYGDDMEKVRQVVSQAVQQVPTRDRERPVEVFFDEFGESSINFSVRIWLSESDEGVYRSARSEAMIAIKKALDAEGITIPFPIRTLDFGAQVVGGTQLDQVRLQMVEPRAARS